MESNRDEAQRCLHLSREKIKLFGTIEQISSKGTKIDEIHLREAIRLAQKSQRLFPTEKGKHWLQTLLKLKSTKKEDTQEGTMEDSQSNSSNTTSASSTPQSIHRSFTKEQEAQVLEFRKRNFKDFYAVLGLKKGEDDEGEIKKAYKKVFYQGASF
jgi:hypothetical protein